MKKTLTTYAMTLVLTFSTLQPVHAQWVVTDPGNTIQNVIQVIGQITQILNEVSQIANQVSQIENQIRQLALIGEGDYSAILGYVAAQNEDIANLVANAQTLRYSLMSIQSEIDATYPRGQAQWSTFNMETINDTRQKWDDVVTEAGSTSARAQTSLDRIRNRNNTINNLMSASQASDGDVRQAQIGNQINGTLVHGINDLVAVETTANRLEMLKAQTEVAENEASREQARRAHEGFLLEGPPSSALSSFPEIQ